MQLYASVLKIDRKSFKELRIKDTYSLHRVVYNLFECVDNETSRCIQWVDMGGDFHSRDVLIFSDKIPRSSIDGAGTVVTKEIPLQFLGYDFYRFEIVVNPSYRPMKRGSELNGNRTKIVPIKGRENIEKWFIEKSVKCGFECSAIQVESVVVDKFNAKSSVTIQKVKIVGQLKVTDRDQFIKTVASGIGRAKGFGCGLLQVTPIIESLF
ncbi:type I-E CRISPR-associated protein Cas6/Cse3/CasE [Vibrio campbellii]|uniref:type I-E CRISPR-associated protein Cas6/Cse3/CasE n=1 Tax=Vibrio campbellii TaxID=680 RepID=UPI000CD33248|nr:type I-E CRISPR-associated protein Cas6/Cse3/CasE [Vibrio campbellii]AUW07378.1 type I-E CRISPR-associated protein Cas6/Cse3/CasE [Vibrio campbellii]